MNNRTLYRRVIGITTAAYGITLLARPSALTKPALLAPTSRNTNFARALGVRDTLSGLSLIFAPEDKADLAVTARVGADISDVITFAILCPKPAKAKAAGIAAGYGLLCSLAHSRATIA